jgi:hypothetical protein
MEDIMYKKKYTYLKSILFILFIITIWSHFCLGNELILELPLTVNPKGKNDIYLRYDWRTKIWSYSTPTAITGNHLLFYDNNRWNNKTSRLHAVDLFTKKHKIYRIYNDSAILVIRPIDQNRVVLFVFSWYYKGPEFKKPGEAYLFYRLNLKTKKLTKLQVMKDEPRLVYSNNKVLIIYINYFNRVKTMTNSLGETVRKISKPEYYKIDIEKGGMSKSEIYDNNGRVYRIEYNYDTMKAYVKRRKYFWQSYEIVIENKIPKDLTGYYYKFISLPGGFIGIRFVRGTGKKVFYVLSPEGERVGKTNEGLWPSIMNKGGSYISYYCKRSVYDYRRKEKIVYARFYKKKYQLEKWAD